MNGQKEDWNSDCFYSPSLLSEQPFYGLRTRISYHNPLGSQFVQFFYLFLRGMRRIWGQSAANLFHCFQISRTGNASTSKGDLPMIEDKQAEK